MSNTNNMKNQEGVKKRILEFKHFDLRNYANIDIDRLVVFGMYYLERKKIPLYFEHIAIALFKLFPKRFSLENFQQYPDIYRINNAARRLAGSVKAKGARWANGNVENGFTLTETGREMAKQVEDFLNNPSKQLVKKVGVRSRGRSPADDVADVRRSSAFAKWQNDKSSLTNYDIFPLLGAMPYAPKELLKNHLNYLKESAANLKDKEVLGFLGWIESKFSNIFN